MGDLLIIASQEHLWGKKTPTWVSGLRSALLTMKLPLLQGPVS